MTFNRLAGQEQPARDLGVAVPGGNQCADLALPLAESLERIFSGTRLTPAPGPDAKASER